MMCYELHVCRVIEERDSLSDMLADVLWAPCSFTVPMSHKPVTGQPMCLRGVDSLRTSNNIHTYIHIHVLTFNVKVKGDINL